MAARLELLKEQFFDSNGDPLSGGKLNTYIVGTTTAKATYTTAVGDVEQANPVVLDSSGRIPSDLYGVGYYQIVLTDSDDVTIYTIPSVCGINSASFTSIGDYSGDLNDAVTGISTTESTLLIDSEATLSANTTIPITLGIKVVKGGSIDQSTYTLAINGPFECNDYQEVFTGTGTVTLTQVSYMSPCWWGENTTPGTTDMTDAIQAAFTAAYTAKVPVYFPHGKYLTGTIDYYNQSFYGAPGAVWYPSTQSPSIIQGKDSEDIFCYPDPGTDATVKLRGTVVKDITMIVDDSTDASGSFATRGGPGNAAMAWPIADGSDIGTGSYPIHARFENVQISSLSETAQNESAGLFFQQPPYDTVFDQVHIARLAYGYWEEKPGSNDDSLDYFSDQNQYRNMYFNGNTAPFQSYNGNRNSMEDVQVYSSIADTNLGISLLKYTSSTRDNAKGWTVINLFQESLSTYTEKEYSVIQGRNHVFINCALKNDYGEGYITWDASGCDVIGGRLNGNTDDDTAILRISGDRNKLSFQTRTNTSTFLSDTGDGNVIETLGYDTVTTQSSKRVYHSAGRALPAQNRSSDFVRISPSTAFNNQDDLWIWPSDITWTAPSTQPTITKDATLQTGEYVTLPSTGTGYFTQAWHSTLKVGEGYQVPIGKAKVYIKLKGQTSATDQVWYLKVNAVTKGSATLGITTSWQVLSFLVDTTGTTRGHTVLIQGAAPTVNQAVDIAWIAVVPCDEGGTGSHIGTDWGVYDFAVNGGAVASYKLGLLFDNAVITRAYYQVITEFTSDGSATVALEVATNDANGIVTATAYDDSIFDAGYHEAIQTGTVANFSTQTTAIRAVQLTVGTAALTAGKLKLWWEYVVGE